MPYARPTLSDLRTQVANDIEAAQPGTDALLRYSPLRIIGTVQAGMAHQHYGYLDYIAKQAVPWTATDEYLAGWGALKGINRKDATAASGTVTFSGTDGYTLSSGTALSLADGTAYVTTSSATVGSSGSVTVSAEAVDTGSAGNCDSGSQMTLSQSVNGIQSTGSAATAFTGGADVEDEDTYYARIIAAYQASPQGGAIDDYVDWMTEISGVTRAWCNPNGFGSGSVVGYFMMDSTESAENGFPQGTNGVATSETRSATKATGDQLAVANALYPLRPATALFYACSPLANTINFTLSGLTSASSATKAAISAAIVDVFYRNGSPLNGTVNRTDIEGAISGISAAAGGVIVLMQGVMGSTTTTYSGNLTSPTGYLPVLGTITYE